MKSARRTRRLAALAVAGAALVIAPNALANHPVLVEGNCNNAADPMFAPVLVGACGDYDGDGRIGNAENADGDRVFGTINGANTGFSSSVNNNGTITVVTSGLFAEQVTLTGNVTLEAAAGVEANVDAVRQGEAGPGNGVRQGQPGIIVLAPANRQVVIRNIQSRNWTSGFQINGSSRVALEGVRAEHNVNYGIEITGNARVAISDSEVYATGRRLNPMTGDFPTTSTPDPGNGIEFEDSSSGTVFFTRVTGSFGAGVAVEDRNEVCLALVNLFDNNPDTQNVFRASFNGSCVGSNRSRDSD